MVEKRITKGSSVTLNSERAQLQKERNRTKNAGGRSFLSQRKSAIDRWK